MFVLEIVLWQMVFWQMVFRQNILARIKQTYVAYVNDHVTNTFDVLTIVNVLYSYLCS